MTRNILLAEVDSEFVDLVSFYLEDFFGPFHSTFAPNLEGIQLALSQENLPSLLIVGPQLGSISEVIPICKLYASERNVPVIVFQQPDSKTGESILSSSNLHFVFENLSNSSLKKVLLEIGSADLNSAIPQFSFVSISLNLVKLVGQLPVSLYLKLGENHFVRVTHPGEAIEPEVYAKYVNRKVDRLYIERHGYSLLLHKLEKSRLLQVHLNDEPNPKNDLMMVSENLRIIQEVRDQIGITPEVEALTNRNIKLVLDLLTRSPSFAESFKDWGIGLRKFEADQCILVAMISISIAKKLGWISDLNSQKLVFAALLHDLSLTAQQRQNAVELEAELLDIESQLIRRELEAPMKAFRDHSRLSAQMVQRWPASPADVDTIIAQHHERPDGKGFPQGLSALRISSLSAVFILALNLTDAILKARSAFSIKDWIESNRDYYSKGSFAKALKALAE